jgi:magnesium transporter
MIETIEQNKLKWHHIHCPTDKDIEFLKNNFEFHPLDLEDCMSKTQRPKMDIYHDYRFIILHFPHLDKENKFFKTNEVKFFWGVDYIITIGNIHWVVRDLFGNCKENEVLRNELMGSSSDLLFYKILERLLNESFKHLAVVGEEIDNINTALFKKHPESTIEKISVTRRNIILLNTIFKPQVRLFRQFESGEIRGFQEKMGEYWGNILDMYHKVWDLIEDYHDIIEGFSKTFDSLQTNRTNEIMKVLTLISSILLPLTLIASMYGMNIILPFQFHPYAFWMVGGSMILIVVSFIFYFKRKKWM